MQCTPNENVTSSGFDTSTKILTVVFFSFISQSLEDATVRFSRMPDKTTISWDLSLHRFAFACPPSDVVRLMRNLSHVLHPDAYGNAF